MRGATLARHSRTAVGSHNREPQQFTLNELIYFAA